MITTYTNKHGEPVTGMRKRFIQAFIDADKPDMCTRELTAILGLNDRQVQNQIAYLLKSGFVRQTRLVQTGQSAARYWELVKQVEKKPDVKIIRRLETGGVEEEGNAPGLRIIRITDHRHNKTDTIGSSTRSFGGGTAMDCKFHSPVRTGARGGNY